MNKRFILSVSGVAALGGLLFGFDTAIISGAIPYITPYFNLDSYQLGWAVSCILAGCAVGALLAGNLSDRHGRKTLLFVCAILFAVSGIGAGLSTNLYSFIFFRIAGGCGVGAAAMVSPMYIAETAPDSWRGRLISFYQLAIVLGILLAYFSNYFFEGMGQNNWRWMFISQTIPSVLFGVLLLLVPETPRWLIGKGREEEATKILAKISGQPFNTELVEQIRKSFLKQETVTVSEIFRRPYSRVLWLGIGVAVFQQVTGINAILYYAPIIFKETGLDNSSSLLQTIGIGVINVLATFIAIGLVDKLGRKFFLLTGCVVMGVSLAGVAICFHFQYFSHYLVLVFTLLYVAGFGCTLGAVTWVYISEIFPNRIRGLGLSIATLSLWIADFIVAYSFPPMRLALGTAATLGIYAIFCALAFLFFRIRVKETKGQSLEKIENLFTH